MAHKLITASISHFLNEVAYALYYCRAIDAVTGQPVAGATIPGENTKLYHTSGLVISGQGAN